MEAFGGLFERREEESVFLCGLFFTGSWGA